MNDPIRRMKESKGLTVLLSILIACILWIFVVSSENPDIHDTIRNVPINLTGEEHLQESGLILVSQGADEVDLNLTGKRNALVNLTNKNILVSADLSDITTPGRYDLPCRVSLPDAITGGAVTVDNGESHRVEVEVEYRTEKTVEISGVFSGSVAKGFQGGEFTLSPTVIRISGPISVLESIAKARVTLTENNLKESFSGLLPIELVDHGGEVVNSDLVTCAATSVYAVYPVDMVREVELTVNFINGGGATEKNVSWEVFPESLVLLGPEEVLADLEELVVGTVDLASFNGNNILLFDIELPEGVVCESGVKQAKVSVALKGLVNKTLEVSRFNLINVPEGYVAGMVTTSIIVVVRGAEAAAEAVQANQLTAEVDFAGIEPVYGEMEVPVKISMSPMDDVGIVQTGYSVRVALTR